MRRRCCCNNTCQLHPSFTYVKDDLTVVFTNTTDSFYSITSHHWDFGDGSTSTAENPSHTYATTGTYIVTLTETNSIGCVRSTTQIIKFVELVLCSGCIGGVGPDEVLVQIFNGTSTTGCNLCTNLGGFYILTKRGLDSCNWGYSETLGFCSVCTNFPNVRSLTLNISLTLQDNNLFGRNIRLEINFSYSPATTDDNCSANRGVYKKTVTYPINCTTPHTLLKSTLPADGGGPACQHLAPEAYAFL